jgi:hypothetical protein
VVGGYVLTGIPGRLAQLARHPRHVPAPGLTPPAQSLASHIGQRTHPHVPGDTGAPLARSGSLPFAPPVFTMPCRNVPWTGTGAGAYRRARGEAPVCSSVHRPPGPQRSVTPPRRRSSPPKTGCWPTPAAHGLHRPDLGRLPGSQRPACYG